MIRFLSNSVTLFLPHTPTHVDRKMGRTCSNQYHFNKPIAQLINPAMGLVTMPLYRAYIFKYLFYPALSSMQVYIYVQLSADGTDSKCYQLPDEFCSVNGNNFATCTRGITCGPQGGSENCNCGLKCNICECMECSATPCGADGCDIQINSGVEDLVGKTKE